MRTSLTIRNCEFAWRFRCPMLWTELSETAADGVRHCAACDRNVYFCRTDEETIEHARAGHCIAREEPGETHMMVGMPSPCDEATEGPEAVSWLIRERAIDIALRQQEGGSACPTCRYPMPPGGNPCLVCETAR